MAVSGTISATTFNTQKVIDNAIRRCRLPVQAITAEIQQYAKEALYLILSDLANNKVPSWCIERQIYPMYVNQPDIVLDVGTVELLNVNYRTMQEVSGTVVFSSTLYKVEFEDTTQVATVGVKWNAASVTLTFQTSDDDVTWTTVGTQVTPASAGEWTWTDIEAPLPKTYFRITAASPIVATDIYLGNTPNEIPLGSINRDTYVAQSNKIFAGRPVNYWFQRDRVNPIMHLWPAPNLASEQAQLIVWRHRHIMDVGTLTQEVEVPQRWLEAIICRLAAKMAEETPSVDANLIPLLNAKAIQAQQAAWDGDNDGSPTFIQPWIAPYTK